MHGRSKLGRFRGVLPQHRVKVQLVNAVLPGGLVMVSVCLTTAIGYCEQNIAFLKTLGQVLRAIDLLLTVGGDFNLVERCSSSQAGFTQYARVMLRRATTRRRAWTLTGKGKVIDFFVVLEELHPVVRTVAVDERPTVMRTHRPVVLTLQE